MRHHPFADERTELDDELGILHRPTRGGAIQCIEFRFGAEQDECALAGSQHFTRGAAAAFPGLAAGATMRDAAGQPGGGAVRRWQQPQPRAGLPGNPLGDGMQRSRRWMLHRIGAEQYQAFGARLDQCSRCLLECRAVCQTGDLRWQLDFAAA